MRSYKLVQYMEQLGQDIQTIIEYLSLNKEHFVTYAIVDPFGKQCLKTTSACLIMENSSTPFHSPMVKKWNPHQLM